MTEKQGYRKKQEEGSLGMVQNYSHSHTQRSPAHMLKHACVVLLHFKHMHSCVACDRDGITIHTHSWPWKMKVNAVRQT